MTAVGLAGFGLPDAAHVPEQAENAVECSVGEHEGVVSAEEDAKDLEKGRRLYALGVTDRGDLQGAEERSPTRVNLRAVHLNEFADTADDLKNLALEREVNCELVSIVNFENSYKVVEFSFQI